MFCETENRAESFDESVIFGIGREVKMPLPEDFGMEDCVNARERNLNFLRLLVIC